MKIFNFIRSLFTSSQEHKHKCALNFPDGLVNFKISFDLACIKKFFIGELFSLIKNHNKK